MNNELKLGIKMKDNITGFEGVAIAKTDWLYGCSRYTLQPIKLKDDGSLNDTQTFDELQLTAVEEVVKHEQPTTGGPRPSPKRNPNPIQ